MSTMRITTVFLMFVICCCQLHASATDSRRKDFNKADSIAGYYSGHSLRDLRSLASKLTRSLSTDEQKFRAIYKWICQNIDYDYDLYLQNKWKQNKLTTPAAKASWNKKFSAQVFKTLLHNQKTVCTGYAYLVRELATYAGLSCVIVDGYGRTAAAIRGSGRPDHSWNAVRLDGKWYLCDATWSTGAYDMNLKVFVRKFDDAYFLADPSVFIRNHFPLDSSWTLLPDKPTRDEFINGPVVYHAAFTHRIKNLLPQTFDIAVAKGENVTFQFAADSAVVIDRVELSVNTPLDKRSVRPTVYRDVGGDYCVDHRFQFRGDYIVHLLLNDSYAVTYAVKVR